MAYKNRRIKVLFGFDVLAHEKKVIVELKGHGYEVQANARYTKQLIQEFVDTTPDLDTVMIKEYLDGGEIYRVDEITALVEDHDVNVVVLLDSCHRGREFMWTLLNAGITNAVFQENRNGVNPAVMAELACKKRSRREARAYYHIQELRVDLEVLSYEQFSEYYQYLMNEEQGINGTDRFLTVMRWLTPKRACDFIKKLPEEVLVQLKTTSEFYDVLDELRARGLNPVPGKRPKRLSSGIKPGSFMERIVEQFGPPMDLSVRPMDARHQPAPPGEGFYGEEMAFADADVPADQGAEPVCPPGRTAVQGEKQETDVGDYAANLQKIAAVSDLGKMSLNDLVALLDQGKTDLGQK